MLMPAKSITAVVALWLTSGVQAECTERVSQTQSDIEAVLTEPMNADQRTRMTALLLRLCEEREPGSSVVEQPGRTVITTHGLNEDPQVRRTDNAAILGVEIQARGCRSKACDRPRNRP